MRQQSRPTMSMFYSHLPGNIIDLKIENLDRVSIPAKSVATFDIRHPIHGTTYGVRPHCFCALFIVLGDLAVKLKQ